MTDLTLEDLAGGGDDSDDSADDSGGEWVNKLFNRLDERGYLDMMIAHQMDMDPNDIQQTDGDAPEPSGDLDAATVAQFGKLVIDNVGDVPMSKVVKFAEANPGQVDMLIKEALGDD